VVDEIQRLPVLLNEIHRHIERRALRFALTGSSARKLRRSGVNLLGGRAIGLTMHPLAPAELGRDFALPAALRWGTLPVVLGSTDRDATLAAYARLYLREEIQNEALVRNLPAFARFLPVAALLHGQTLSVASLARDAGVARTTVEDYLSVLEDTLVAIRLPAFEARLRVRERAHPKLFWFDPGVVRALRGARGAPAAEERGALFEGLVLGLLRLYRSLGSLEGEGLAYWAPSGAVGTEVDFVVSRGTEHVAIEVKSAPSARDEHMRGLRAIAPLKGLVRRVLVHAGAERGRTPDGIDVRGIAELATELHEGTLFP
jgi:predicted AAA+ superfamily ATPase